MIENILTEAKRERAEFAREVAYIREMHYDDEIDDIMDKVDNNIYHESSDDYKEAMEVAIMMQESYPEEDAAEMKRIMEATDNISFDEMIGVEPMNE
jgi:hypothetical protein